VKSQRNASEFQFANKIRAIRERTPETAELASNQSKLFSVQRALLWDTDTTRPTIVRTSSPLVIVSDQASDEILPQGVRFWPTPSTT